MGVGSAIASLAGLTGGSPPIGLIGRAWICLGKDEGGGGALRDADNEQANAERAAGVITCDGVADSPFTGNGRAPGFRDDEMEDRIGIGTDPAPIASE
jgi:hypothetical protein